MRIARISVWLHLPEIIIILTTALGIRDNVVSMEQNAYLSLCPDQPFEFAEHLISSPVGSLEAIECYTGVLNKASPCSQ